MPVSDHHLRGLRSGWPQTSDQDIQTTPLEACGISFDATAIIRSPALLAQLHEAAAATGLSEAIVQVFAGAAVNVSEDRPALHMALRDPRPDYGLDKTHIQTISETRERITNLADALHGGGMPDGQDITDIVHIGIGGSDLGPRMLCRALDRPGSETPQIHFLSAPASEWPALARRLQPETTLVIAVSKSFGTAETLHNLALVDAWQQGRGQRLAVTANFEAAGAQGFDHSQILPLWPWVGGRYAFSSAVSLSAAVRMGGAAFAQLLDGAHAMDRHFRHSPLNENLPANMALLDFWQHIIGEYPGRGVFAFEPRLGLLAAWLQQLETESNGKDVDVNGNPLTLPGAPLVFGGDGSDAQHALFQMLHQGQTVWPLEFVGVRPADDDATARLLYAQLQGQARTFREGAQDAPPHARLPGNRPVSITLLDQLDARRLGALLAAYEHKTYCLAQLIGCNPFDQWGVEAGKQATLQMLKQPAE